MRNQGRIIQDNSKYPLFDPKPLITPRQSVSSNEQFSKNTPIQQKTDTIKSTNANSESTQPNTKLHYQDIKPTFPDTGPTFPNTDPITSYTQEFNSITKHPTTVTSSSTEIIPPSPQKNKIQVIVNCDETEKHREELEAIGTVKYVLPMINSYVLEIYEENIRQLAGIQGVVKIEQDANITAQMDVARETIRASWQEETSKMGEGITVAVLDTGLYPHNDFTHNGNRIVAFKDFVNHREYPYDDNGHGTHVAGIVAGDGYESDGKYAGIAPKCNLVAIKVLNKEGAGNISDVLAGIQWVLDNQEKYHIKIMNLSVGMEDLEGEDAALVKGVNVAWDRDIVVVCAAGNNGPEKSTITTPGVSRKVITVGASDDNESVTIMGDFISNYSSRGPTKSCIKKPDVVAPGSNIISCNCHMAYIPINENLPKDKVGYIKKSGTSMATPIVTGMIARLLSDYPNVSNKDLKLNMKYSTHDLGFGQEQQGWGLIDLQTFYENIIGDKVSSTL